MSVADGSPTDSRKHTGVSSMNIYTLQALVEKCASQPQPWLEYESIESDYVLTDHSIPEDAVYVGYKPIGDLNINYRRKWTTEELQHLSNINKERNINFVTNGATEAARLVNTGKKQSKNHVEKRAKNKCRKVIANGKIYNSGKECAKELNIAVSTVSARIKRGLYKKCQT